MINVQHIHNGSVVQILLDRPEKNNALDESMIAELTQSFIDVQKDDAIKVVVISSTGEHFCAGADLQWMKNMAGFSEKENHEDATRLAHFFDSLYQITKPVVCLVDGATYGGGLGLIACADIVLATRRSHFCFSEVKLGLIPATIAPYVIKKIGQANASRYFLTAEVFDVNDAKDIHLVTAICTQDTLDQHADEVIGTLLQNAPHALSQTKALIRSCDPITADIMSQTSDLIAKIRVGDEAQEGIKSFFEKRQPNWAS